MYMKYLAWFFLSCNWNKQMNKDWKENQLCKGTYCESWEPGFNPCHSHDRRELIPEHCPLAPPHLCHGIYVYTHVHTHVHIHTPHSHTHPHQHITYAHTYIYISHTTHHIPHTPHTYIHEHVHTHKCDKIFKTKRKLDKVILINNWFKKLTVSALFFLRFISLSKSLKICPLRSN